VFSAGSYPQVPRHFMLGVAVPLLIHCSLLANNIYNQTTNAPHSSCTVGSLHLPTCGSATLGKELLPLLPLLCHM
jgi:hypothetical protein